MSYSISRMLFKATHVPVETGVERVTRAADEKGIHSDTIGAQILVVRNCHSLIQLTPKTVRAGARFVVLSAGSSLSVTRNTRLFPAILVPLHCQSLPCHASLTHRGRESCTSQGHLQHSFRSCCHMEHRSRAEWVAPLWADRHRPARHIGCLRSRAA